MIKLPRNHDPILNTLSRLIEKHFDRKVNENPYNPRYIKPRTTYLSLTHLEQLNAYLWVENGGITDDTLTNEDFDNLTFAEARVGTLNGSGVGYDSDYSPLKHSYRSLERIVHSCLDRSFDQALQDYNRLLNLADLTEQVFMMHLAEVEKEAPNIVSLKTAKIPYQLLRKLGKETSKILGQHDNTSKVRIKLNNDVRRYVNSEGTILKDSFFGYHFRFIVQTIDQEKRPLEFIQNLYFMDDRQIKQSYNRILNFTRLMAKEVEKRKDCPVISEALYPTLYNAPSLATSIHECLAHMLASDHILDDDCTTWGWENFHQQVANRYLHVHVDPGMKDKRGGSKWGSIDYDYEGMRAMHRSLIEDGHIVGYLADRHGAHHLSKLTGVDIYPGDSRFGMLNNNTAWPPQPRITNLDVDYKGPRKPKTWQEIKTRFKNYLRQHNLEGVYLADPTGSGAGCTPSEGTFEAYPYFPYLITPQGKEIPTKFVKTSNSVQGFMKNIKVIGKPRVYCPHRCGDDEYQPVVRAGILCGPGIVKNVLFVPTRVPGRRQS